MSPRIFVPFTKLRAQTYLALPDAKFVALEDDYAYGRYFQRRWKEGLSFINVEHDVVPIKDILLSMWSCPNFLCSTRYAAGKTGENPASLGCSKISADYIRANPDLNWDKSWAECDNVIKELNHSHLHCCHGLVLHLHEFLF